MMLCTIKILWLLLLGCVLALGSGVCTDMPSTTQVSNWTSTTQIRITAPAQNAKVVLPIYVRVTIASPHAREFFEDHSDSFLCALIDHVIKQCADFSTKLVLEHLETGRHTLRLTLERDGIVLFPPTEEISFEILSEEAKVISNTHEIQEASAKHQIDIRYLEENIFDWSLRTKQEEEQDQPDLLIIGVKTSVHLNFAYRQAIRATWKKQLNNHRRIKLWFIGCRPTQQVLNSFPTLSEAIAQEKQTYQDLLTDELENCEDGYDQLVHKVKSFFHFIHTKYTSFQYAMITDDDIFLRVKELEQLLTDEDTPTQNLFAGQVWQQQFNGIPVKRAIDPKAKNYVPPSQYPMKEFLPFPLGPHYLVSKDCVDFIAENYQLLQGVGALDDVSIAVWLLPLQVHPVHVDAFQNFKRATSCREYFMSFADLTPFGIRAIGANLDANRPFCHGLMDAWGKHN